MALCKCGLGEAKNEIEGKRTRVCDKCLLKYAKIGYQETEKRRK